MDAIDHVVLNAHRYHLGMAARIVEPAMKLVVLTCMDARVDTGGLLGLQPGDAHVIRNAGGRATPDALRAVAVSQAVLGTREVMVLHHTECALGRFTQAELAARIAAASGHPFTDDLGCFSDPLEAIAEDVERIRSCRGLTHRNKVRGFMYDLGANAITEVDVPWKPRAMR